MKDRIILTSQQINEEKENFKKKKEQDLYERNIEKIKECENRKCSSRENGGHYFSDFPIYEKNKEYEIYKNMKCDFCGDDLRYIYLNYIPYDKSYGEINKEIKSIWKPWKPWNR